MPQLNLYVNDELAERIQRAAKKADMSVSRYLAEVVRREVSAEWPAGFFEEVIGGWQGKPLERATQGAFEKRDVLETHR